MRVARIFMVAIAISLIFLSCSRQKQRMYKKGSLIMDTLVSISVVADSKEEAENAIDEGFQEIRRLERLLSFWTEDSEIAMINQKAGSSPVAVSPETFDIIEKSIYISSKTGGAFDPTIGPVIRLWDFKNRKMPSRDALEKALRLVDYRMLKLDRDASTAYLMDRDMSFDTGGIAKGYAADRAVEKLRELGIRSGLVAIAGDIRAFGRKPDGRGWNVGIRNPRDNDRNDIMATIELMDEAISTSGDYERFFIHDGKRYHHLLDPDTGFPAEGCISVSVVTDQAVFTDGFSTGVFVMGPRKGLALLNKLGFEGIIVDSQGNIHVTGGIRDRIQWTGRSPSPTAE